MTGLALHNRSSKGISPPPWHLRGEIPVESVPANGYKPTFFKPVPSAHGGEAMKRRCVLLAVLISCLGCASVGDKTPWDEALKDLRGDNMQMHGNFSALSGMEDQSLRPTLRD